MACHQCLERETGRYLGLASSFPFRRQLVNKNKHNKHFVKLCASHVPGSRAYYMQQILLLKVPLLSPGRNLGTA